MGTAIKANGNLRISLDPWDLNEAIKREHYPMPAIEEVIARIPKAKIFSVLDATSPSKRDKQCPQHHALCMLLYGRAFFLFINLW